MKRLAFKAPFSTSTGRNPGEQTDDVFDAEGNWVCSCRWPRRNPAKVFKADLAYAEAVAAYLTDLIAKAEKGV